MNNHIEVLLLKSDPDEMTVLLKEQLDPKMNGLYSMRRVVNNELFGGPMPLSNGAIRTNAGYKQCESPPLKFKQLTFEIDKEDGSVLSARCPFGVYKAYFDRNGCDIYFGVHNDGVATCWIAEITSGDREKAMQVIQADFEKRMNEGIVHE